MASNYVQLNWLDPAWDDDGAGLSSLERRQRKAAERADVLAFYSSLGFLFFVITGLLLWSEIYAFATAPSRALTGAFLLEVYRGCSMAYAQLRNFYTHVGHLAWTLNAVVYGPDFTKRGVSVTHGAAKLLARGLSYLALALSVMVMYRTYSHVAQAPLRAAWLITMAAGVLLGAPPVYALVTSYLCRTCSPEPVVLLALLFGAAMCWAALRMGRGIAGRLADCAGSPASAKLRGAGAASSRRPSAAAQAGGGSGGSVPGGGGGGGGWPGGLKRSAPPGNRGPSASGRSSSATSAAGDAAQIPALRAASYSNGNPFAAASCSPVAANSNVTGSGGRSGDPVIGVQASARSVAGGSSSRDPTVRAQSHKSGSSCVPPTAGCGGSAASSYDPVAATTPRVGTEVRASVASGANGGSGPAAPSMATKGSGNSGSAAPSKPLRPAAGTPGEGSGVNGKTAKQSATAAPTPTTSAQARDPTSLPFGPTVSKPSSTQTAAAAKPSDPVAAPAAPKKKAAAAVAAPPAAASTSASAAACSSSSSARHSASSIPAVATSPGGPGPAAATQGSGASKARSESGGATKPCGTAAAGAASAGSTKAATSTASPAVAPPAPSPSNSISSAAAAASGGGGLLARLTATVSSATAPVLSGRAAKKAASAARKQQGSQPQYIIVPSLRKPAAAAHEPAPAAPPAAAAAAAQAQPQAVRNAWLNPNPVIKQAVPGRNSKGAPNAAGSPTAPATPPPPPPPPPPPRPATAVPAATTGVCASDPPLLDTRSSGGYSSACTDPVAPPPQGVVAGAAIGEPVARGSIAPLTLPSHNAVPARGVGGGVPAGSAIDGLVSATIVATDASFGPLVAHKHASGDLDISAPAANYRPYPSSVPPAVGALPGGGDPESESFSFFSIPPPGISDAALTATAASVGAADTDAPPPAHNTAQELYNLYGPGGGYSSLSSFAADPVWNPNLPALFSPTAGVGAAGRGARVPPPGFPSHAYGGAFASFASGVWAQHPPVAPPPIPAAADTISAPVADALPLPAGESGVLASLGFVEDGGADGSSAGGGEDGAGSCAICWSAPRQVGFLHGKTSHLCVCRRCAAQLREGVHRCPMCRQLIERIIDIF